MVSLDQTKRHFRNLITGELTRVFEEMEMHLPGGTKKLDTFLLLKGRYADLLHKVQRGVISTEEQRLETNRIREQLLEWIDGLKEEDLETGRGLKKKKRFPLWIPLAVLVIAAMVWGISFMTPFGPIEKEEMSDPGTADTEAELRPDSTSKAIKEPVPDEKGREEKKANSDSAAEKKEDLSTEAATVEVQLMVDVLWKDSEIRVNGKAGTPLKRIGTLITLALPPGSHEIQLISGGGRCVKMILVREEGQRISITCD